MFWPSETRSDSGMTLSLINMEEASMPSRISVATYWQQTKTQASSPQTI